MTVNRLEGQELKLAEKVRRAMQSGRRKYLRSAIRGYVNSYAARYVAAKEAVDKCKRRSHKPIEQIAREMNVWQRCDERAYVNVKIEQVSPQPRQVGDYDLRARVWLSFGPENQARQILIRNLLKAMWCISARQTIFGGGRTRAVQMVKDYYAEGYQHIVEVDIHRCFQSFDRQGIATFLCLPEKVNEHVLGASSLNLHPSVSCRKDVLYHSPDLSGGTMDLFMARFGEDWDPAQLGLIEGSKVSSFAAELLLAPVCDDLVARGAGQVVNYADNFLLMARSKSELSELCNILREGLHTHPAGPLQVKALPRPVRPQEPFEFLGYKFLPNGENLSCMWGRKAETKARKVRRDGHRVLASKMPPVQKEREFSQLMRKHRGIVGAFPEWRDGVDFHRTKMEALRRHFKQ